MFRILLIIGLLFAGATQGFARKVDIGGETASLYVSMDAAVVSLEVSDCCDGAPVPDSKSTYCKSDCKGVISANLVVPFKSAQLPDSTAVSGQSSVAVPLEPGPPKA